MVHVLPTRQRSLFCLGTTHKHAAPRPPAQPTAPTPRLPHLTQAPMAHFQGQMFSCMVVQIVPEDSRATVLAADATVAGIAGTFAPIVGAVLYHKVGFAFFGAAGSTLVTTMVLLVHTGLLVA